MRRRRLGTLRIVGWPIDIRYPSVVGQDSYGDDITEYSEPEHIENVLVKPNSDTSMTAATRDAWQQGHPEAIECDVIFYLPREYDKDVRGALIDFRGETYEVVGSPSRYIDENLPYECDWNLVVKGTRHDG